MKKVLFTATVKRHILSFHLPYLKMFKERGYEVHVAAAGLEDVPYCDQVFNVNFERSPYKKANIQAYKQLKKMIKQEKYTIIHCHTPMGGVLTRLAARSNRILGTKVIYTAHGFHFFKGASLINWMLYYPIEKWLAKHTDVLITINQEDYSIANQKTFKAGKIELVNGIGINLDEFSPQTIEERNKIRGKYGYKHNDFILMYAGELSNRKYQALLISVVALLKNKTPNIKLILAGTGILFEQLKEQVKDLGVTENVDFLGHREDISKLLIMSDVAVSASRQEGLPVNVMEAMATGLPLVVSNCRGNRDLVIDGYNGYVIEIGDKVSFVNAIENLFKSAELRKEFGGNSLKLVEDYALTKVKKEMEKIYFI